MGRSDITKYPGIAEKFQQLEKAINQQDFTATANQDTFTITNGSYAVGTKTLSVYIEGVLLPLDAYTEVNSTTFKLISPLNAGDLVTARWLEGKLPVAFGHKSSHEKGGQDELDITKLKGYDESVGILQKRTFGTLNVKEYGAIGDGVSHPVYPSVFATLTDLQYKYPYITNAYLTSIGVDPATTAWRTLEVDWCAITQALLEAKQANNVYGRSYTVLVPIGSYICRHPFQLYSGLTLTGSAGINGNEFDNRTSIWNGATDTFVFNGADVTDICIAGLTFSSSTVTVGATNWIQAQDTATGYIIRYSNIYNCAFKYFNYVISGRILGTRFYKNNINNGTHALKLSGSDSMIEQNYIAVQPNNDATFFIVELSAFTLNRFTNNFITGRKSMALKCYKVYATVIDKNWFDYTDASGVFIQESKSTQFTNNFFGRNCTAAFSFYTGAVTIYDSTELLFEGNTFYQQPAGITQFSLRKSLTGCSKITIQGNAYDTQPLSINVPSAEEAFITDITVNEAGSKYSSGNARYNWFPIGKSYFDTAIKREVIYEGSGKWRSHVGCLAWSPNSSFSVGDRVVTNNNVYDCTVSGTTGATNPVHTTGTGADGTVTWSYVKSII